MKAINLTTVGMHCSACTALVEGAVRGIEGVISVTSNEGDNRTAVLYDEMRADVDAIHRAIVSVGFEAAVES